jgi:hypothetical protein
VEDPCLAFEDGHQLVEAAQRREASSWAERDEVLSPCWIDSKTTRWRDVSPCRSFFPQVKSLIRGLRGWDTEGRAARVVATAVDVLAYCAAEPAGTPPSFRIFSNTRRRVLRAAIRDRSEPLVPIPDLSYLEDPASPETIRSDEQERLNELVEWVRQRGRLREDAARLVVLTRVGGASVSELASAREVSAQTMRRQRLRAEQRLRHRLSVAR